MLSSPTNLGKLSIGAIGVACGVASMWGCTNGATVILGDQSPRPFHFGTPRLLAELGALPNDNPTLTSDLLEIFFTSARDVWTAHRSTVTAPFEGAALVEAASTPTFFETSSAISLDGLTLWVGSDRDGGFGDLDIWMLRRPSRDRAWSAPINLPSLNSPMRDVPRQPGWHDLVMPLASQRDDPDFYHTYLSSRASAAAPFEAPQTIPELVFPTKSTVDAFLSADGLAMLFSSAPLVGFGDLFVAWRRTTSEPFALYEALTELNTAGEERDPWLSPDGQTLFFTSDHSGMLAIYEVSATRP